MTRRYPKEIGTGIRLLSDAELDAVIGGYVAPGCGAFTQVNVSTSPLTWATVGATGALA